MIYCKNFGNVTKQPQYNNNKKRDKNEKSRHSRKFIILAIFNNSVMLIKFTLLCNHHYHPSPRLFLFPSCNAETLYTWNVNSPFYSSESLQSYSTVFLNLCTLDIWYKWNQTVQSFCDWLISLSIMSSRLIHVVVVCVRITFFCMLNNISLYV
jgi:hypothetical protein